MDTTITRENTTHQVRGTYSCNSANVVYLIRCRKGCPEAWYIGETMQTLRQRMNGHRAIMTRQECSLPVGEHFSSQGHSASDLWVSVLQGGLQDARQRRIAEQKLIAKFRTRVRPQPGPGIHVALQSSPTIWPGLAKSYQLSWLEIIHTSLTWGYPYLWICEHLIDCKCSHLKHCLASLNLSICFWNIPLHSPEEGAVLQKLVTSKQTCWTLTWCCKTSYCAHPSPTPASPHPFAQVKTGIFSAAERTESLTSETRRSLACSNTSRDVEKEYVGFATLPNQVHRKSVKKGFDFTLMVAGESGLGKSTLVKSLFLTDLYKDRKLLNAEERINQTVEIIKHTVDIEEKGVKLKLTIVDTPGFGDAVNNIQSWKPIADYIDQQFEQYFRDESGLNRKNIQDNRVHCCLYFISPYGHGLRPLDTEFMKALHQKVNIVPVIAKADSLTPIEVKKLKERIRDEIEQYGIKIYQFPECDSDEDDEFKQQDKELKESIPFAVIGSNTVVEARGQRVRGRLYPWGIVEVENQAHCDFVKLRNMLIRTHMQDLKDVTWDIHYENFRARCIQEMTSKLTQDNRAESPVPLLPVPTPDAETEKLIKMKDEELRRMQEMLQRMQQQMQDQ
ncbi:septin 5a isoform X1 [Scyliorhinus torazame]|uniref:septin 5a isoform X1 n=2 Tax=Scyliorhinus torazame TaxID=75743 RepID=UPI003B58D9CA